MLELLTAFTRLVAGSADFLVNLTTAGSRLAWAAAVGLVAIGVGITLWSLLRPRPGRPSRLLRAGRRAWRRQPGRRPRQ